MFTTHYNYGMGNEGSDGVGGTLISSKLSDANTYSPPCNREVLAAQDIMSELESANSGSCCANHIAIASQSEVGLTTGTTDGGAVVQVCAERSPSS
mmetsp:Transcript_8126/g.13148  ORF Transcript_8126/g.13148 Transcript_8126/m.13148 type:complete len:96 (+) Transcript_8126:172-459(+)